MNSSLRWDQRCVDDKITLGRKCDKRLETHQGTVN